jgi:polysaccharide biosynthesis transport protein
MNFTQFLLVLIARAKIILIIFGLVVLTTLVINLLMPKTYKATSSLVLNYKGVDPVTGLTLPAQLMPGYIATQIDIITSRNVALRVVDQLKLSENKQAQEQFQEATNGKGDIRTFYADKFLGGLEATPSRESSVIEISYSSTDPDFSATMANAFAEAYQETSIQLKVEPSQKAADFLGEKTKALRTNLENAQARLSKYQQEKGLTSVMGSLDVESARLNDISSQLVAAQSQSFDSISRQQRTRGNGDESPDVAANPIVQNLKMAITSAESKLSELAQRIGSSHPHYQAAEAELNKLKSQLLEATNRARTSIGGNASINKQLESELRAALASQKARVLELNLSRDELEVLQRDVENAQRAVDSASQRFTQTTLEGGSNQADIAVLSPAIAPQSRTSPRILFNLALAGFFGTFLGIGVALLTEMKDGRVRRCEESVELLQVPVLAVMKNNQHTIIKRFLIGVSHFINRIFRKKSSLRKHATTTSGFAFPKRLNRYMGQEGIQEAKRDVDPFNAELIAIKQPNAPQVEALRVLRSQLLKRWFSEGHRSLAIVSANAGEASCYLAANLAVIFSQLGKSTLLIDANLRDPHQHVIFNIKANVGLSEILAGHAGFDALTESETLENLSVLAAGSVSQSSHELLSQDIFTEFMKKAVAQYEIVLIDAAPTALTADAQDTLARCEGALIVSRLNHTRLSDLIELRDQITVSDVKLVGSVINDF